MEKPTSQINEEMVKEAEAVEAPAEAVTPKDNFPIMKFISIFAVIVAIYHFLNAKFMFWALDQHKVVHLAAALVITFLLSTKGKGKIYKITSYALSLIAVGIAIYTCIHYYEMQARITPSQSDLILGIFTILMVNF